MLNISYKQNHTTWHFQFLSLGVVLSKFILVRSCRMIFVLILRFYWFLCVWMLTWMDVCTLWCMQSPRMPKEDNGCPGTGVTDTWEFPLSARNWTQVPLEEQLVLLTADLTLQSPEFYILWLSKCVCHIWSTHLPVSSVCVLDACLWSPWHVVGIL